ncbi:MAG TPA: hypothetical protein VN258_19865 [Mobilitalea sp.]|nr:hypothetical protein [Mobilitalea sp.]
MIYSIKDKNLYKIEDEAAREIYYGSNQDWYGKRWQRLSGCGPSAVANVIYYLSRTREKQDSYPALTKEECLAFMNEIWNYVTPSFGGVSSTAMLCKGMNSYLKEKNLNIQMDSIDIPKKKSLRPDVKQVLQFIMDALKKDSPVTFLNLEHGTILELESWHWVTIVSLEYETDGSTAFVEILDGGLLKRIDLLQWLNTTKLGGGFVSFEQ